MSSEKYFIEIVNISTAYVAILMLATVAVGRELDFYICTLAASCLSHMKYEIFLDARRNFSKEQYVQHAKRYANVVSVAPFF